MAGTIRTIPRRALGALRGRARRLGRSAINAAERVMVRTSTAAEVGPLARAGLAAAARGRLELLYRLEGRHGSGQIWQGAELLSGAPMRAAFIGDERAWKTGSPAYLQHKLFEDGPLDITELGDLPMRAIHEHMEDLSARADLIIVERSRLFQWEPGRGRWRVAPTWVRMGVRFEPGESWEAVEARMHGHKNNIRRFQKYGFQLRASRDEADFDLFYDGMHEPMVTQRHGEYTELEPKESLRRTFCENGLLLFAATPEGETVAGKLLYHYGHLAYVYAAGTLDGDPRWHELGALSALTWYQIRWAYENGLSTLDCGAVRPFAGDGNYLYKLRWGIQPIPDPWAAREWLIWVPDNHPAALAWMEENPIIEQV